MATARAVLLKPCERLCGRLSLSRKGSAAPHPKLITPPSTIFQRSAHHIHKSLTAITCHPNMRIFAFNIDQDDHALHLVSNYEFAHFVAQLLATPL
jgi:hypothetical protein